MDNKSWLWRKRSSEKTILATNKFGISVEGIDKEAEKLQNGNELGSVRPVRNLNEKLASVLLDSSAKDDLLIKQEKLMQEDIAGQEEAKVVCLKKDLDEALKQGVAANEKLPNSDAALKACMQQLSSLQEEQEQKIQDAVMKAKIDFDKEKKKLEDKLREMNKKVASLAVENTNFSKALVLKDKLVGELHIRASQTAAEFDALMARLDTTEKENALLKYEFHMLEKELEVRNEELEYTRRSADASHRKHLESVKKISNLESECQRLRVLMRKKLPGPATLARMKNEVETLGRNPIELRKPNPTRDLVLRDTIGEKSSEIPVKNINFLIEQLRGMEEENRTLKEILTKKNTELRSSRIRYSQTASKLTQVETKLIELSGGQKHMDLAKCSPVSSELYPLAGFDFGSDDGLSSSGSWANALMSELEHFRDAKLKGPSDCRAIEVSNISLMDDFVEMEKLALVSAQTPSACTSHSLSTGKELVPVVQGQSGCNEKQEVHSRHVSTDKSFDWIQEVLNAIFKEQRISKRSLTELLEDIKIALGYINHPSAFQVDTTAMSKHLVESDNRSCITCKSPYISSIIHSLNEASTAETSAKETMKQCSLLNLGKSIGKIIQLIEGINPTPRLCNGATDNMSKREESFLYSAVSADYSVHIFQWRSSELSSILKRFILACNSLLNGKAGIEFFAEELLFTLDWIVNSCVTPKDASSARDKIKRHFSQSESQRDSEVGVEVDFPLMDSNAICGFKEKPPYLPSAASFNEQNSLFQIKSGPCNLREEIRRLKDELKNMESGKEEMEIKLQRATDKNETLMMQLQKSEQSMKCLLLELESMRESKGMIEDQMENQKLINEDLDTQLTVAKAKLNEVLQKFTSLEVELEEKSNCCEELEATCLELQLQLESVAKKESSNYTISEDRTQNQNGSDITAASLKLAECQETILNLGKQLKALATPTEAALFDKVFNANGSTTTAAIDKPWHRRFSLRDQMLAEDTSKAVILRSPTTDAKDNSNNSNSMSAPSFQAPRAEAKFDSRQKSGNNAIGALAIVPGKKQGIGFFRRLLMRRKKDSIKKSHSLGKV